MAELRSHKEAYALLAQGRKDEALALTEALTASERPPAPALHAHAAVLKARGRGAAALEVNRRAVALYPQSAVAWHNLAATLGDLEQAAEAESGARQAMALGLQAPETRLVLARALQSQGRLDEADAAYREALALRPGYADALRDVTQLTWMRTSDAGSSLKMIDEAVTAFPGRVDLVAVQAMAREHVGDAQGALAGVSAALSREPQSPALLNIAARLSLSMGRIDEAADLARRLVAADPRGGDAAGLLLAEVCIAQGDVAAAEAAASQVLQRDPNQQRALALLATAWRMAGDPRYKELYDYGAFVATYDLEAPAGWSTLSEFLQEAAGALDRLHSFISHPFAQSVRHGSQAQLRMSGTHEPAIEGLLHQLRGRTDDYAKALGKGDDPYRRRNTGATEMTGLWSIRLRASGFHTDHVHPEGWISSACYVALPALEGDGADRAGWIKFGEPGVRTPTLLPAEHHVQPRPGRLVLFPSYMWHGTVPFSAAGDRLTVAFDAQPLS